MTGPRAVTRDEMRRLDETAIRDYAIPSLLLMENAGRAVAEEAARLAEGRPGPALLLCGKGSNGGDGFVAARHLANRGREARVAFAGDLAGVDPASDPGVNLEILLRMRVPLAAVRTAAELEVWRRAGDEPAVVVDALLGTGLTGPVREPLLAMIAAVNAWRIPVLAVDLPSGLDCDSGAVLGAAIRATVTVTLGLAKRGFYRGEGPRHAGRIVVADISLPREIVERAAEEVST